MKKRISALFLCGAMCVSMAGPALALDIIEEDGKLVLTGTHDKLKPNTDYNLPIMSPSTEEGKPDMSVGTVTVSTDSEGAVHTPIWDTSDGLGIGDIGVALPGEDRDIFYGDDGSSKPNPPEIDDNKPSGNKKPVIDDGKDDDDSSSTVIKTSGSGGASGASSKYIKNEPRGNQTVTPVTTPSTEWTSETNIPQFTDVASTDWFYNAVQFVGQHGMMAGSNGRFSPYDKLTRGMMAQILYNMEGAPGGTAASFPDVSSSDWFANAASWAASCGYMSGYSNGYFGPLDPITREQLASILYRYASAKGYDVTASSELNFTDGATTSSWSVPAMKWAVGTGLLSGKTGVSGTRLDPLGNATRAEVAQILMNFSQKIAR